MKLSGHIVASVPVGIASYSITKSYECLLVTVLSHIFIDCDHMLDYLLVHKRIPSLKQFFSYFHNLKGIKSAFYILHSWELMAVLAVSQVIAYNSYLFALWLGLTSHLLVDQIWNGNYLQDCSVHGYFYFFIYRFKHKFDHTLLRKGKHKEV